jgi:hypothetical protein
MDPRFIPKLPQQAAFALYNYIIGYIMFYVRHPKEKGQVRGGCFQREMIVSLCLSVCLFFY